MSYNQLLERLRKQLDLAEQNKNNRSRCERHLYAMTELIHLALEEGIDVENTLEKVTPIQTQYYAIDKDEQKEKSGSLLDF